MKLTNKLDLPQAYVDAVKDDPYSKGDADISVTELIKSPRPRILIDKYDDQIVEDVSDRVLMLEGQCDHVIMERANRTAIAERRLSIVIEGWKVSGGMDLYEESGYLVDWKTTSVGNLTNRGPLEWERQLNCYAVILRHHGHKVEKMRAIVRVRDWRPGECKQAKKTGKTYPGARLVNVDIPLWDAAFAEKYMRERVILHKQASLSNLPQCTKEERYAQEDSWAVWRLNGKKASKVFKCEHNPFAERDARAFAATDRAYYVEFRVGGSVRCESYCKAAPFCDQWKAECAAKVAETVTEEVS